MGWCLGMFEWGGGEWGLNGGGFWGDDLGVGL